MTMIAVHLVATESFSKNPYRERTTYQHNTLNKVSQEQHHVLLLQRILLLPMRVRILVCAMMSYLNYEHTVGYGSRDLRERQWLL